MNHWNTVKNVRGIYKVTNKINGKVYIGQSVDIGRRWRTHMNAKDDIYFHKAIQKYGVENFEWEVIEQCKKKDLDEREIYWIEYYDSFNNGYNCTKGGDGGPIMHGGDHPNWKGGVTSDPERLKQYNKQYYETNKEKAKEYREANKEKIKQHHKQYYEAHKEELKEKAKQQQKEYRETHKEKAKEYRETHKEKTKEYREVHKEELKEYHRQRYINKKSMKKYTF